MPGSPRGEVTHVVRDPIHQNMPVAAFRFPAGWRAQSQVRWNFQHYSYPYLISLQAQSADGSLRFEWFPSEAFYWIEPSWAVMGMLVPGRNDLGQTCGQPLPGPQALAGGTIPRHRGRMPGFKVLGAGEFPNLVRQLPPSGPTAKGVCAMATYHEQGRQMREDFFALHEQNSVPNYGPQGVLHQINWGLSFIHSFKADAALIDQYVPMFQGIIASLKLHPAWQTLSAQILQQLAVQFNSYIQAGYSQIQAAAQASRAISANNDAMLAAIDHNLRHSWSSTPSSSDSTARRFSDSIRGVETYEDPYWGESQHSSDYDYVWTDGFGNYQSTNDALFDPNIGGTVNWQVMKPKP